MQVEGPSHLAGQMKSHIQSSKATTDAAALSAWSSSVVFQIAVVFSSYYLRPPDR